MAGHILPFTLARALGSRPHAMIEGARAAGIGALQRHRSLMIPDPAGPARTDRVTGAVEKLRWDLVETPGLAARGGAGPWLSAAAGV